MSMLMYAVAVLPLIRKLSHRDRWVQNWYADDASCFGSLQNVRDWLSSLMKIGPKFGYHPEPSKSVVVVSEKFVSEAKQIFEGSGVTIATGSRFLGGFVGSRKEQESFLLKKVEGWENCVQRLSSIAKSQPQAAYAALSKSLQFRWFFLARVTPGCESILTRINESVNRVFWPALFGSPVSIGECALFGLPTRRGGMGIRDPVGAAMTWFRASLGGAQELIKAIRGEKGFSVEDHAVCLSGSRMECRISLEDLDKQQFEMAFGTLNTNAQRAVMRAVEGKTSNWLNVLPFSEYHFDLSPVEFRDAISLRYGRNLPGLPAHCDGCGDSFSVQHALDCKKGGLVIRRHNEIRDALGDVCALVFPEVVREPVVKDVDDGFGSLVADLGVRGLWQPQVMGLIDVRVVDTDAPSYVGKPVEAVLNMAEKEKKTKYNGASEERRASFSPFVVSTDGFMGREASFLIKHLAERLADRWQRHYGEVKGWLKARLLFSVIRASGLCIRGSRVKWRSVGMVDGAGLPF